MELLLWCIDPSYKRTMILTVQQARASGTKRKKGSRRSNKAKGRGKVKNAKDIEEDPSALSEAKAEKNGNHVKEEDSDSEDSEQIRSKKIKREDVYVVKEVVKLEDSSEGHKDETRVKTVIHGGSKVKGTMAVKQKPRRYHRDKIIKEELKSLDEQKELIAKRKSGGHGERGASKQT